MCVSQCVVPHDHLANKKKLLAVALLKSIANNKCSNNCNCTIGFLAVQNSSIGDLVTHSLTD